MSEKEIIKKYQGLFDRKFNNEIKIGNGWFSVLEKLLEDINVIVEKDELVTFKIISISQNFGSLRIAVKDEIESIEDLIQIAIDDCSCLCEFCGKPGELFNYNGLLKTVCEDHTKF